MNVRLKKEFQSLLWPWLVAMFLGLLPILSWLLPTSLFDQNFGAVYTLSSAGFFLGIVLLAALPFGEELNLRTLPMLLAQPCNRLQIWREKQHIALLLTSSVALVHAIGYLPFWGVPGNEWKIALAFLVFSLSSATFWTLLARSTIGGAVLCLATQSILLLLAYAFTETKYYTTGVRQMGSETELFLIIASLILSPIFLWLGWRLFSGLQLASNWEGEAFVQPAERISIGKASIFQIRPASPFRNLILKELHMYKPVFAMMFLFASLWISIVLAHWFLPQKVVVLSNLLNGVTLIYIPLVLLVSGCISLGEEKNLGTHLVNLTMPVTVTAQWALKLAIACLIGIAGGLIIPVLLVKLERLLTVNTLDTGVSGVMDGQRLFWIFCLLLSLLVPLSFWAATVLNRTIQAAFLAGFSLVAIAMLHGLGNSIGENIGWLTARPVVWLIAHFQLPLYWPERMRTEILFLSYSLL